MLAHPRLLPYFTALCGTGYRLDHSPFILQQRKGADGFVMHGGRRDVRPPSQSWAQAGSRADQQLWNEEERRNTGEGG